MDRWLALLVLPTFFLLMLYHRRRGASWRLAFLLAACGWGTIVALSTESLSLVSLIRRPVVIGVWAFASILAIVLCARQRRVEPLEKARGPGLFGGLAIGVLVIFVGFQWVIGYVAPPNNWDSMTYHLPRVMHWIQNRSLQPYPTNIPRQLHLGPFAEMCILHLQLLARGDWFANLVQWFAMVGNLVGVSLIAARLGASRFGQVIAAIVCYTIPMGILQATTTQNDQVEALWLVAAIAIGLELVRPRPRRVEPGAEDAAPRRRQLLDEPMELCALGGAAGLAVLTKGTSYFFLAPFAATIAVWYARAFRWRAIPALIVVAAIALLINAGQFSRNHRVNGSILGQSGEGDGMTYAVERVTLPGIASNMLRNAAIALTLPELDAKNAADHPKVADWLARWNGELQSDTIRAHDWTDLRAIPTTQKANDPAVSWAGTTFTIHSEWSNEDYAANPWHGLLIVLAIGSVWCRLSQRRSWALARALLIAAALFCIMLRWQPWHNRLQLPLFVIGSAIVGVAADRVWNRWISGTIAVLLLASAVPYLLWHHAHPAIGPDNSFEMSRDRQYFRAASDHYKAFQDSCQTIRDHHWKNIGFAMTGGLDWEYPIWVYLSGIKDLRIENVDLPPAGHWNDTVKLARLPWYAAFHPDVVILSDGTLNPPESKLPTSRQ